MGLCEKSGAHLSWLQRGNERHPTIWRHQVLVERKNENSIHPMRTWHSLKENEGRVWQKESGAELLGLRSGVPTACRKCNPRDFNWRQGVVQIMTSKRRASGVINSIARDRPHARGTTSSRGPLVHQSQSWMPRCCRGVRCGGKGLKTDFDF